MEQLLPLLIVPGTVVLGILLFCVVFWKPIAQAIGRINSVNYGNRSIGFEPKPAAEKQRDEILAHEETSEKLPAIGAPPPPNEPVMVIEDGIKAAIAASSDSFDVKQAWVVRALAVARLWRDHEIRYRTITGSQIELMLRANSPSPVDEASARSVYDIAAQNFPDTYRNFSFDTWLNWPINSGLMRRDHGTGRILITPLGQDFLHYLVDNGLTLPKTG